MRATTHANGFLPVSTRLGITGGAPARLRSYTCPPSVERFAGQPRGLRRLPFGAKLTAPIRGLRCQTSDDPWRVRGDCPWVAIKRLGGETARSLAPASLAQPFEHVGVVFWPMPRDTSADKHVEGGRRHSNGLC